MGSAGGQGVFQMFAVVAEAFKAERTLTYVKKARATNSGSLEMFAAILLASSLK